MVLKLGNFAFLYELIESFFIFFEDTLAHFFSPDLLNALLLWIFFTKTIRVSFHVLVHFFADFISIVNLIWFAVAELVIVVLGFEVRKTSRTSIVT